MALDLVEPRAVEQLAHAARVRRDGSGVIGVEVPGEEIEWSALALAEVEELLHKRRRQQQRLRPGAKQVNPVAMPLDPADVPHGRPTHKHAGKALLDRLRNGRVKAEI